MIILVITGATKIVAKGLKKFGTHTRKKFTRLTMKDSYTRNTAQKRKVLQFDAWAVGFTIISRGQNTSNKRPLTRDLMVVNMIHADATQVWKTSRYYIWMLNNTIGLQCLI